MTQREFERNQRKTLFGTNIPNVNQKRALQEASTLAVKRDAAINAGFVPPTQAATGDVLARRQELAKQMLSGNREQALELRDTAESLGINSRGFGQVLNQISLNAKPSAPAATPAGTPPAGTAPNSPLLPAAPAPANPLAPKPFSVVDRVLNRYDESFKPESGIQSREDQVADTIKRVRDMTASSDEKPNSMLRTTALDQINKERVESGKAPLKFGKSEWDSVGKVDSLLAARASADTRQKERSRADGSAPVIVGGERVKGYEGLTGDQLRAIAEQGRQRREGGGVAPPTEQKPLTGDAAIEKAFPGILSPDYKPPTPVAKLPLPATPNAAIEQAFPGILGRVKREKSKI